MFQDPVQGRKCENSLSQTFLLILQRLQSLGSPLGHGCWWPPMGSSVYHKDTGADKCLPPAYQCWGLTCLPVSWYRAASHPGTRPCPTVTGGPPTRPSDVKSRLIGKDPDAGKD